MTRVSSDDWGFLSFFLEGESVCIHFLYMFAYFIITYNNMDSEGLYFIKKLKILEKKNKNFSLVNSLGSNLYFELINIVDLVMGNSSSGIIEVQ